MSAPLFFGILIGLGIVSAAVFIAATVAAFKFAGSFAQAAGRTNTTFADLIAYVGATLASGVVLIGLVLVVVSWTNRYPELQGEKPALWIGFVGAVILWTMLRKNRV